MALLYLPVLYVGAVVVYLSVPLLYCPTLSDGSPLLSSRFQYATAPFKSKLPLILVEPVMELVPVFSFITPPDKVIISPTATVGELVAVLNVTKSVSFVNLVVVHVALPIAPLPSFHECPLLIDRTVSMLFSSIVGGFSPSAPFIVLVNLTAIVSPD